MARPGPIGKIKAAKEPKASQEKAKAEVVVEAKVVNINIKNTEAGESQVRLLSQAQNLAAPIMPDNAAPVTIVEAFSGILSLSSHIIQACLSLNI